MKSFVILLLVAGAFSFKDLTFNEWQNVHGITFSNLVEKSSREKIFLARKAEIEAHNANSKNTYMKTLNQFAYLDSKEFIESRCKTVLPDYLKRIALMVNATKSKKPITTTKKPTTTTKKPTTTTKKPSVYPFGSYTPENAPSSVDFTYLMEPVQDQGSCGACWAFATMGQIEGMLKIRNSSYNTVLGPQYLIDCNTDDAGCDGGWATTAMDWLKDSKGGKNAAPSMASYPYTAFKSKCKTKVKKLPLGIKKVTENFFNGDEDALKAHIANYGPTVVAIFVTPDFLSYHSGVFYDATCPSGSVDCFLVNHAVIITGYGTDPVYGDYWQVKNSWNSYYGENGYIRMARNRNNNCNIACWTSHTS